MTSCLMSLGIGAALVSTTDIDTRLSLTRADLPGWELGPVLWVFWAGTISFATTNAVNVCQPDQQIPTITLHDLRHTWATLALTAGIDIKFVRERLNHSSTHITREIHTHVTPPMQTDAAEASRTMRSAAGRHDRTAARRIRHLQFGLGL